MEGYFEAETTPGIWKHSWRPIQFCISLMTLVLDMWVENMPTAFAKSSKNIMKYQKIENVGGVQVLNWNGIIPTITMTTPSAYQSKDKLINYFSDLSTSARPSRISLPIIIARFTMNQKYNWPQRSQPAQFNDICTQQASST